MTTAIYYNPEERHSLPSLSSIMNNSQTANTAATTGQEVDLFSNGSQPSTANTTPASSFSSQLSSGSYYNQTDKCTCKSNANRIPRPRNAFILFRQKYHQSVLDEGNVIRTNPEVSRELGRRWRALLNEDREHWNKLAEEEKTNHAKKYPGYRYTPRRNGKGKLCDHCKQKNLRQQQMQMHNHQIMQMQQDQYASYVLQQQQAAQMSLNGLQINNNQLQNMSVQPQFNQQYLQTPQPANVNLQQPYNNMVYLSNPLQNNFQFQYGNDLVPNTQDKLSPLLQVPLPYDHHYHPQSQTLQPQFAIGYEQPRFNSLPNPVSNMSTNYGFDYQA